MPVLFSVVAREATILAKYASCAGNFVEIVEQVFPKVPSQEFDDGETKLTFAFEKFFFHVLVSNGITFLCIADMDVDRTQAFAFLDDVRNRFETTYRKRAKTALPYAMNSDFSVVLCNQMKSYFETEARNPNKIKQMRDEVEDLKSIMIRNIDNLVSRGERLELLVDRTENLESGSVAFRDSARKVSSMIWWKNIRMTIIIVVGILLFIFVLTTIACGGFSYSKC